MSRAATTLRTRPSRTRPAALTVVLLASGLCGAGCATTAPSASTAAAIRSKDWAAARQSVSAGADPLAATLLTYLRLLTSDAQPGDIAAFLLAHPDWPDRASLRVRYDQALERDPDDASADAACRALPPRSAKTLARCADADANPGEAANWAREAWRDGFGAAPGDDLNDQQFLARWRGVLTDDDHWQRFEQLTFPRGNARRAATEAASLLSPDRRAVAAARLALASARDPLALYASVPPAGQDDPALVLSAARQLRRNGDDASAVAFWRTRAIGVEALQPAFLQAAFFNERDLLARALLTQPTGGADAFALADDAANASPAARSDALFLAGWIALRRLGQPALAAARFRSLGMASASVTTRARASYWLARAEAASGASADALRDDAQAATFPTTFYGQRALASLAPEPGLASLAPEPDLTRLHAALAASAAPGWTTARAVAFASSEAARAAVLLVAWGEARHAKPFLGEADAQATDAVGHALAARLAITLGLPDEAVAIARRSGRNGQALLPAGWPRPVSTPPGLPAPLLLGLIRQESGFDPNAVSPSGALGLMQLLPATAAELGRRARIDVPPARLTADPALNMRLGAAYLAQLLARFGGNVPMAVAAYNAGPHRVSGWPAAPHAPPDAALLDQPDAATVDWIESIPIAETRNYVERVLENQAVYAALGPSEGSG